MAAGVVSTFLATLHKILFTGKLCKSLEENERRETLFTPLSPSAELISPGLFYKYFQVQKKQQQILTQPNRNSPRGEAAACAMLQCHQPHNGGKGRRKGEAELPGSAGEPPAPGQRSSPTDDGEHRRDAAKGVSVLYKPQEKTGGTLRKTQDKPVLPSPPVGQP